MCLLVSGGRCGIVSWCQWLQGAVRHALAVVVFMDRSTRHVSASFSLLFCSLAGWRLTKIKLHNCHQVPAIGTCDTKPCVDSFARTVWNSMKFKMHLNANDVRGDAWAAKLTLGITPDIYFGCSWHVSSASGLRALTVKSCNSKAHSSKELVAVQSVPLQFSLLDGWNIPLIRNTLQQNFSFNTHDRFRISAVFQPCNYPVLSPSMRFLFWHQVVVLYHYLNVENTNLSGDNNHRQKKWLIMDFYTEVSRVLPANTWKAQH